jgi:hypothetical protein
MSECVRFLPGAVLFARVGANLRNEPNGLSPGFGHSGTNCAEVKLSDSAFCETNPMSECVRFLPGAVLFARVGANLRNEPNRLIPGVQAASLTGCNGVSLGASGFCGTNPIVAAA